MLIQSYEGKTIMEWAIRCKVLEQERDALALQLAQALKAKAALKAILDAWETMPHQPTEEASIYSSVEFHTFDFWFSANIDRIEEIVNRDAS